MQGSIQRPGFIAKFVLAAALLVAGGFAVITTTDARADTQYYSGSYYGKTYRNNWGDYQTSTIPSYAYCGGGHGVELTTTRSAFKNECLSGGIRSR